MLITDQHPEDIKAVLRKRYGTVRAFAHARDLKPQSIADWFRGRTSARVTDAIEAELREAKHGNEAEQSIKLDDSAPNAAVHRLNAGAR
ncbi:helix-turn-helix domain-containing protein [Sphingomonas sp.]|uniref:helix-turn-helix domain-containing protein n=1 Tax=Sphingomonas sp. TaxID=28214 RepID=UPI002EDB0319